MLDKSCFILFILHANYAWMLSEVQQSTEDVPRNKSDIKTTDDVLRNNSGINTTDGIPRNNSNFLSTDGIPRNNSDIYNTYGTPKHNIDNNTTNNQRRNGIETSIPLRAAPYNLIYPGTKWCGAGNTAKNYGDLGEERETDKCCRDHDNCPDSIDPGETKYNLTNNAFYSKLSCACDEKFLSCLKSVGNNVSKRVGILYFDAMGTQCFRLDYPIRARLRHCGWMDNKCVKYSYYTDREKKYQWFDLPTFSY